MLAALNAADSVLGLAKKNIPVYYGGRVWIQAVIVMPCMEKPGVLFQDGLSAQRFTLIYPGLT